MMQTIAEHVILDMVRDHVIAAIPDSVLSPQQFDPRVNPGGRNFSKMISFGISRSDNTDLTRGRDEEIFDHTVRIGIAERMRQGDQYATGSDLLRRKEAITSAMANKGALQGLRVRLRTAAYPISSTREYQFGLFDFRVRAIHHVAS